MILIGRVKHSGIVWERIDALYIIYIQCILGYPNPSGGVKYFVWISDYSQPCIISCPEGFG